MMIEKISTIHGATTGLGISADPSVDHIAADPLSTDPSADHPQLNTFSRPSLSAQTADRT